MKRSRKTAILIALVVLVIAGVWGVAALTGASTTIDPAKIALVARGTMRRSVVATGKVEPITKVAIKSKADGIIEKLYVDVDQLVPPGRVLAELDRENITARLRQARANLQAAEAALEAYGTMRSQGAAAGRFIDAEDVRLQRRVVFIGSEV